MIQLHAFDKTMATLVARIPKSYGPLMVLVSAVGSFWLVLLVTAVLFTIALTFNKDEQLINLAIIVALTPLAELAKLVTRRKRPKTLYVQQMRFKTYSFPSGHSYVSTLICGYLITLTFIYITSPLSLVMSVFLGAFALLVGISRVYLGAHFPSDVLAGWFLAGVALYLTSMFRNMFP